MSTEQVEIVFKIVVDIIKIASHMMTPFFLFLIYHELHWQHKWWREEDEIDNIGKND
jgi:hypothetical protein